MKRIKLILLCLILPLMASAQEKTFEFYYIAHDYTTKVNDICSMLEEKYEMAVEFSDCAMVFYLPDRENPKIVKMNVPGDNRGDFEDLLAKLRGRYAHETYAYVDIKKVVETIDASEVFGEDGSLLCQSFRMVWFVNPSFWSMNYNESLISALYFILDLEQYGSKVTIDIWNSSEDRITYDRKNPFGTKNLMGKYPFHLLVL